MVLDLIWKFALQVPHKSSFISSNFLYWIWTYYICCLRIFLFFHFSLSYYNFNLNSSIIYCLFFEKICLSFDISADFEDFSKLLFSELFVVLSVNHQVLLLFLSYSFWCSFNWICSKFLSMMKRFLTIFSTKCFADIFRKEKKKANNSFLY